MAGQEVLNQDEIDALLNGVDAGAVNTDPPPDPGVARQYDFSREMRIVRGRMPTLEMVNERLARQLRVSIYNLLRRTVEIAVGQVSMKKFSEYTHSLSLPVNLNLVKINPLRGTGLFVIDPKLVFAMVDNFFGGVGRQAKIEGREFTATEMRVVHMLLRSAFADMKEAWTPIAKIDVEYVSSEINPNFASIVTPSEVELTTVLGGGSIALSQLVSLQPGDVLPCDFAGKATVSAEGVPLFRGAFGVSRGQQCVRYEQRIRRPGSNSADRTT